MQADSDTPRHYRLRCTTVMPPAHIVGLVSRIAITGAAGFIGSHLSERLIAEGDEVLGIDCFAPNYAREVKLGNLTGLTDAPRFLLVDADIADPALVHALRGCRAVVHLAAMPGVRTSDERGLRRVNVEGTVRLLRALTEAGVPRMVLASSSAVYGPCRGAPVSEREPPAPASFYGHTKLAAEIACRESPLELVTLRYFTVYGERQRPDMAFAAFISAALGGTDAPLIADGRHVRHFTFIADVVEATVRALRHARAGSVYNIAGPEPASVLDALGVIEASLGRTVTVCPRPAHPGEALRTHADLSRARRDLDWAPRVGLADGLRRQLAYTLARERGPAPSVA